MHKIKITGPRRAEDGWVIDINVENRLDMPFRSEFDSEEEALRVFDHLIERIKTRKLPDILG